jgi:hypothetical protein
MQTIWHRLKHQQTERLKDCKEPGGQTGAQAHISPFCLSALSCLFVFVRLYVCFSAWMYVCLSVRLNLVSVSLSLALTYVCRR